MAKNYYGALGVPQTATEEEIRRRFRRLAVEKHPDRFRGEEKRRAEREFQGLTEAFNALTDPERRRVHDLELRQGGLSARPTAGPDEDRKETVKALLARGVQAYKEGNLMTAAESFDRATKEDPSNPQAWYNLALTCSRQERFLTRAAAAVERACELEPMKPSYLKLAGRIFARTGKPARAERYYEEALTWGGDDAEVTDALRELKAGQKGRRGFFGKVT
ncbi:MAG TPA: DnaJ domain-containing protein [Thermoanaerobaculia bacterium]|nr:DnaJ domain-containing protein [Thermoanaerobaculia bacterium]